jgi:hypothetical protein
MEFDTPDNEYRRMGPGSPVTPEQIEMMKKNLHDLPCKVCGRLYGDHDDKEFDDCIEALRALANPPKP